MPVNYPIAAHRPKEPVLADLFNETHCPAPPVHGDAHAVLPATSPATESTDPFPNLGNVL